MVNERLWVTICALGKVKKFSKPSMPYLVNGESEPGASKDCKLLFSANFKCQGDYLLLAEPQAESSAFIVRRDHLPVHPRAGPC